MGTKNTQDHVAAWLPSPPSITRSSILPHGHEANASVTSSRSEVQHQSERAHLQSEGQNDNLSNRTNHGGSTAKPGRARDLPPKPCHRASPKDWEVHRAIITQLYVTENKSLSEVMTEMKILHGFDAT